jgi:flavin-dependent dehydrogenase
VRASAGEQFDVAVVGAGVAGAAAAALLARAGARVALVARDGVGSSRPAETCSPATLRLIRALDLPQPDAQHGARTCRGVLSTWDAPDPQFFDYALRACEPALAIDRSAYDSALVSAARAAGASVVTAGRQQAVARCGSTWTVGGGRTRVRAAFLVDATGRGGGLLPAVTSRRRFGDRLVACSFRQPRLEGSNVYTDLLLLAAVRGGWWYVSQSGGDEASVVYLTDADLLPRTASARSSHFARAFRDAPLLQDALAPPQSLAVRVADARTSHRLAVAGDGWMAVGDAALSVDPLSGEGLRLAIASAAAAKEAVVSLGTMSGGARERFADWYRDQEVEQRRFGALAYAPAVHRFADDPFWQRRAGM